MMVLQPHVIQELTERPARNNSPVLSVYLNFDPTNPTNRRGGHKLALEEMLKQIEMQIVDDSKRRHFLEDASWTRRQMELHMPKGRSAVLFCDASEDFFFHEDLPIRLANQIWYGETPYLRPLLQTLGEYERYGVVLVDKEKARFFVLSMGSIEEVNDAFQTPAVRHRRTVGSDHMRSQMILQRRAATWSGWFLKEVSDILSDIMQKHQIDRILLAGQEDVTAELYRLLPKAVASRVVESLRMPITTKSSEVLELVSLTVEQIERQRERELVQELLTISQKAQAKLEKAVLGSDATLDAVNQARVYRLIYPASWSMPGCWCPACDVLLDHPPADGKCPYCSGKLDEVDDLTWLAAERVLAMGGKVEEIRDPQAKEQLKALGSIGAYLR